MCVGARWFNKKKNCETENIIFYSIPYDRSTILYNENKFYIKCRRINYTIQYAKIHLFNICLF